MLEKKLTEIRACTICANELVLGPRPIVQAHHSADILIIGQAAGIESSPEWCAMGRRQWKPFAGLVADE